MATTAAPFNWYDKGELNLHLASIVADDIKVALCFSSYTPNSATHEFFDVSVTNELSTGLGYTAGGQSLATKALTIITAGSYKFTSDNPSWSATGGTLTARLFVLYNNTPSSNKPLIGYGYLNYNGGSPVDVTVADTLPLTILLPSTGWFYTEKVNG